MDIKKSNKQGLIGIENEVSSSNSNTFLTKLFKKHYSISIHVYVVQNQFEIISLEL